MDFEEYKKEALSIKNRKKRIEYIYDKCCEIIDNKYPGIDTCGFKNGICACHQNKKKKIYNGCCRKCYYQSNKGCTTKNLACKLFNCSAVKNKYDMLEYKDLELLKLLSFKNRYIIKSEYFSKREDILKDLYCYTFTWSMIRICTRQVILHYKLRKRRG